MRYRVTLRPAQGTAPKILGVRVTALTEPSSRAEDEIVSPRMEATGAQEWQLSLDAPDRIIGAEIALTPPVAPLAPEFRLLKPVSSPDPGDAYERHLASTGLIWNLPALDTRATRVSLEPITADRLKLCLPEGAHPEAVRLLVRRDVLLFPAEAGKAYFLHYGGQPKQAPGNLGALPDSSRAVYQRQPLKLGGAEVDPQGLPKKIVLPDRSLPWLPWVTGLVVVALGFAAWKLLKAAPEPGK